MGFKCEFCGDGALDIIKFTVYGKDFCGEECAKNYRHEQLEFKFKRGEEAYEVSKRKAGLSTMPRRRESDS